MQICSWQILSAFFCLRKVLLLSLQGIFTGYRSIGHQFYALSFSAISLWVKCYQPETPLRDSVPRIVPCIVSDETFVLIFFLFPLCVNYFLWLLLRFSLCHWLSAVWFMVCLGMGFLFVFVLVCIFILAWSLMTVLDLWVYSLSQF